MNVPVSTGETLPGPVWFRPIEPAPVPTSAETVQVVPLPVTAVMAEPLMPLVTRLKTVASTPLTSRLKVTLHDTDAVTVVCTHAVVQVMAVTTVPGVVYTSPINVPVSTGETLPGPVWFKPSVPAPVPRSAVTVQLVPEPVTEIIAEPVRPVAARPKALASTPETLRLKVTFHDTDVVIVVCSHVVAQVIAVTTVAGVVYTSPSNVPVSTGETLPGPVWFKPNVPAPVPTSAVTVQVVPLPVTEVMADPVRPLAAKPKTLASTPETLRLKVTFHDTEVVIVVCTQAVAQLIAVTTVAGVVYTSPLNVPVNAGDTLPGPV